MSLHSQCAVLLFLHSIPVAVLVATVIIPLVVVVERVTRVLIVIKLVGLGRREVPALSRAGVDVIGCSCHQVSYLPGLVVRAVLTILVGIGPQLIGIVSVILVGLVISLLNSALAVVVVRHALRSEPPRGSILIGVLIEGKVSALGQVLLVTGLYLGVLS